MIQIRSSPRPFPHGGIEPGAVALFVIDMQRDFLEPEGYLASLGYGLDGVRAAIEPAQRLLRAARAAGLVVVHTRAGFRPDLAEVPPHRRARIADGTAPIGKPGPLGRFLIRGEPGWEIVEEVAPVEGEIVIDKSAPSAFQGTDLEPILSAHGVRATIFAGVTTDVCVTSTLRDAGSRGYECMLAVDACGSGDPEAHRGALHLMSVQDGIHGVTADVATIEDALARVGA